MNRCVLVFGLPRSGTTWIGKLLDSHPDTLYRHEPDSVHQLAMPLFPNKSDAYRYRQELECFIASLPYMRSPKVVGKQPLFRKNYHSTTALFTYRASVAVAKTLGRIGRNISSPYRPTAQGYEQACLIWKSIESDGRLGLCMEAIAGARAIFVLRHPCGYVASVLRGEAARRFGDLIPSGEDYWLLKMLLDTPTAKIHKLTLEDIERLTPEERLAWRWVLTQEKILADVENCDRVLTLRYEDVCAEPVVYTKKMFEFVGLNWQVQTENFVRTSTQTANNDYYSVYRHASAAAQRWRSELAPEVIERIIRILRTSRAHDLYYDDTHTPAALSKVAV